MKCIYCQTDNTLKDRMANQGRCKQCDRPFAFEPTQMPSIKITDPMFKKAITDLSVNNSLRFTVNQLYYFLNQRLTNQKSVSVGNTIGCFVIATFFAIIVIGGLAEGFGLPPMLPVIVLISAALLILVLFNNTQNLQKPYQFRRNSVQALLVIGVLTVVAGSIASFATNSFGLFVMSVLVGMSALYLGNRQIRRIIPTQNPLFQFNQFQNWLQRWQEIHGSIDPLLPPPNAVSLPAVPDSEVTAYSFDRLVVCDSAQIAQLLITNNFHFENNCAILSINGYPENIFQTVLTMVKRNPDLKVYALHNCSIEGMTLAQQLRGDPWFPDNRIAIIDVGISPRQVMAAQRGIFVQNTNVSVTAIEQLPIAVRQELTPAEIDWLKAGNYVELESFTPQQLIRVLQRGIAGSRELEMDDREMVLVGSTDAYIYSVDSFG